MSETKTKVVTPKKQGRAESPVKKIKKILQKKSEAKQQEVEKAILRLNPQYFVAKLQEIKEPDRKINLDNPYLKRASQIVKYTDMFKDSDQKQGQLKDAQTSLPKEEVKSKLAQYFILDTFFLPHNSESLHTIIKRWQKEVNGILTRLFSQASEAFESRQQQAEHFALLCTQYLLIGENGRGSLVQLEDVPCPYTDAAWNFILPLVEGRKCLCTCYATYIRAAAEEFGFDDLIYLCNNSHFSSIITVDEYLIDRYVVTAADVKHIHSADTIKFLEQSKIISVGDVLSLSRILSRISMSFKDGVHINITSRKEEQNVLAKISKKLQRRVDYVDSVPIMCDKTFLWNDEVTLITRITTRKHFRSMYMRLICMGYVYSNENYSFIDLIDAMLLLHLIYVQRNIEYDRWLQDNLSWENYLAIQAHLNDLAAQQLEYIYYFILDRTREPFSVRAILAAVNSLSLKVKEDILAKQQAAAVAKVATKPAIKAKVTTVKMGKTIKGKR